MKIIMICLVCLVSGGNSYSQDLTGTWLGEGNDYKIVLIQIGDSCFGYTYDTGMGYCQANFKGKYDSTGKRLKGINTSFIKRTLSHGLSSYKLRYVVYNNVEFLEGRAAPKTTAAKIMSFGIGIPVRYRKQSAQIDTTLFIAEKLAQSSVQELVLNKKIPVNDDLPAPFVHSDTVTNWLLVEKNSRQPNLVNTISTDSDSIRLILFDNGEIDNDTVTVFVNGKVIIDRLGLTDEFFSQWVVFQPGDTLLRIELMANNLGSIPPNTANLFIWANKQKYELKVSSDFTKNAVIDIRKEVAQKISH